MNTIALSSRPRAAAVCAAAGVTALVGTLAASGPVDAAGSQATGADVPRLDVTAPEVWCYQGDLRSVTFFYDDRADGHVPQVVREEVSDRTGVVWTRDDLYQEQGNYFNVQVFSYVGGAMPFDRDAAVTYTVTMTYDDGVTQSQSTSLDLATACTSAPPTTTPATTTPATTTPAPIAPRTDRFVLRAENYGCGAAGGEPAFLSWRYQDVPDGHYDVRYDVDLMKNSVVVDHETITTGSSANDGLTAFTEYASDGFPGGPLEPAAYSLSITIRYEDGATEQHVETFDLAALCDGRVNGQAATTPGPTTLGPTTTAPAGTLPETGSGDATWVIGALAGALMTAGAAVFAGARRSRTQ